jgi:GT2 family glycosyltransferase
MSEPRITIGILTRNHEAYLAEAIDSVLKQDFEEWELIISDDASTDRTPQIAAEYAKKDSRISSAVQKTNLGQAGNWSFLLSSGTAPIVTVLHGDDYWTDGFLNLVMNAFDSDNSLDMVYGNWWRKAGTAEPALIRQNSAHVKSGTDEFRLQIKRNLSHVSATALTRSVINSAGFPNQRLRMVVDFEYLLRIMLYSRRVRSLVEPIAVYRGHDQSATNEGTISGLLATEKAQLASIVAPVAEPIISDHKECIQILSDTMAASIFSDGLSQAVNGQIEKGGMLMDSAMKISLKLRSNPRYRLDRMLCRRFLGPSPLRLLHSKRVSKVNTAD